MVLIPGLPDDIALDCLIRVPYRFHSVLKSVSRKWRDLLNDPSFYQQRRLSSKKESFVFLVQAKTNSAPSPSPDVPSPAPESEKEKVHHHYSPPVYGLTVYNATADTWHRLPESPLLPAGAPMFCQCVALAGKLVLVGGWDPQTLESVADVYVYDLRRGGGWRRGAPLLAARSFFACAAVGEKWVYVAGGHDNQKNALRSAEAYDVEADAWREVPAMSEERDECVGVSTGDGRFWVVSGYSTERQGRFDSSAECYEPWSGRWTRVENAWPFPNTGPRGSCSETVGSWGEGEGEKKMGLGFPRVWFVGRSSGGGVGRGEVGLREYDEREETWRVAIEVDDAVSCSPSAALLEGQRQRVFVIGSTGALNNRFRASILDLGTGKWKPVHTPIDFSGFVHSCSSLSL